MNPSLRTQFKVSDSRFKVFRTCKCPPHEPEPWLHFGSTVKFNAAVAVPARWGQRALPLRSILSMPWNFSHAKIGVGMTVVTSPLPPNRTGGFPASGFPVGKFPRVFMLRGWLAWLGLRLLGRLVQVPPSRH